MALIVKEQTLKSESETTVDNKTARRIFLVESDDGSPVTPVAAEAGVLATFSGNEHPDDSSRLIVRVAARKLDAQRLDICQVDVNYSSNPFVVFDPDDNPLDDDDIWSVDTEEWEEEYYEDTAGTKAILTNGKPMSPRPRRRAIGYRVVIKKNVATNYALSNFAINNTVNSDSVTYTAAGLSWSAGGGHIIMQLSEEQTRSGVDYRVLTINVTLRAEGHRQYFDSRDKEQLVGGELVPIKDQYGREVDFAYPLTNVGAAAASATTAPHEIELKPYTETAHNTFINA